MQTHELITTVDVQHLGEEKRMFLLAFAEKNPMPPNDPGLAIYLQLGDEFFFIEDARVPTTKSAAFSKEAPSGLYRGGTNGFIRTAHGLCVVSDERREWFKPFPAGLAH